jgi:anti-sigma factor RsiW
MKCDEAQSLHGPYLDSELDAKTTVEIQQHLKSCPDCARFFAEEEKLQARIMAGLNQGQRSAGLWEEIEHSLVAAAPATARSQLTARLPQPAGWQTVLWTLSGQLHSGWRRFPRAWTGLAASWVGIFALLFAAREPDTPLVAGQQVPSRSEMHFALIQKQLLMSELAVTPEPVAAEKPKAAPPSRRGDRGNETLNS